ncbi:hypothetical protein E8E12_001652 [Didymella heteroderae]|uniref:Uncharacterized protein n=1 Tax=Didymella heteroderae TaxID=1769908 RepID=A0A9P4WQ41_9PLEO|nr:hypothetical protein E8E12_001652 [Didymella heteroderae]
MPYFNIYMPAYLVEALFPRINSSSPEITEGVELLSEEMVRSLEQYTYYVHTSQRLSTAIAALRNTYVVVEEEAEDMDANLEELDNEHEEVVAQIKDYHWALSVTIIRNIFFPDEYALLVEDFNIHFDALQGLEECLYDIQEDVFAGGGTFGLSLEEVYNAGRDAWEEAGALWADRDELLEQHGLAPIRV